MYMYVCMYVCMCTIKVQILLYPKTTVFTSNHIESQSLIKEIHDT